jgi:hypothetical protein
MHAGTMILVSMRSVRRNISLPPAVAERLEGEARRRGMSLSRLIVQLAEREPGPLPYAGLIEDDPDLSLNVEQVLARLAG